MPSIFIEENPLYHNKVKWIMHIISQYTRIPHEYVLDKTLSNISVGSSEGYDIIVESPFFLKLENGLTKWKDILPDGPIYKNEKSEECLLETIFYLVNCIQEINPENSELDQYGRFKYIASLQYHYGIIETNYVGELIDRLIEKYPILTEGKGKPKYQSQIFLSHDIDIIHAGWKVETYLALKDFNLKAMAKVLKDLFLQKPFYDNIDQVMELDNSFGFKSCFYWLPSYGKDESGIMNADYTLEDLIKMTKKVSDDGFECGIHKSSFPTSFAEEMSEFLFKVAHNRYHFLKFQTHQAWKEIDAAGLKTDASLGFAEHIGFRNSYGLPFVPFDMENDKPYGFVEIPLHVMDLTLSKYMELNLKDSFKKVEDFIFSNDTNSIISVLWHNNMISEYMHYESMQTYKHLLSILEQKKIEYKLPNDLVNNYFQ